MDIWIELLLRSRSEGLYRCYTFNTHLTSASVFIGRRECPSAVEGRSLATLYASSLLVERGSHLSPAPPHRMYGLRLSEFLLSVVSYSGLSGFLFRRRSYLHGIGLLWWLSNRLLLPTNAPAMGSHYPAREVSVLGLHINQVSAHPGYPESVTESAYHCSSIQCLHNGWRRVRWTLEAEL